MSYGNGTESIGLLCATAASIGFFHTLLGPDHYVPFVTMARVGRWTLAKTIVVTLLCGVAHVLSSFVIGMIGVIFGVAVLRLEHIESFRGHLAGWLLVAFGIVYFLWAVRKGVTAKPHTHLHAHADGTIHAHQHMHRGEHLHLHNRPHGPSGAATDEYERARSMSTWILFIVLLFGPCELLIPVMMYPAALGGMGTVFLVTLVFGAVTLATMTAIVVPVHLGVGRLAFRCFGHLGDAIAGLTILMCGVSIELGL